MKKTLVTIFVAFFVFVGCGGDAAAENVNEYAEPNPITAQEPEPRLPARTLAPIAMTSGARTDGFNDLTAAEWVNGVRVGWSLGNTFDAHSGHGVGGFSWIGEGTYATSTVEELEAAWTGYTVTRELIDTIHAAGFNTLRIPVTWFKATDDDLIIREDWMERVLEVAGWAMENDMYTIINTHHDEHIFKFMDADMEQSKQNFVRIWEQIAYAFRDFGEKLVFQGLNEPRTVGSRAEWSGGTEEERNNINILNQLFVDTVRASGGNNAYRILSLTTYAASAEAVAQRAFVMPQDTIEDRIFVALHIYAPWEFALKTDVTGTRDTWNSNMSRDTAPITNPMDLAYELFVSQGIPVVIGEMGALNRNNIGPRVRWTEFFVSYARSLGMPCIWWDSGITTVVTQHDWGWDQPFGLIDRATAEFVHPRIVDALMEAAGLQNQSTPEPTPEVPVEPEPQPEPLEEPPEPTTRILRFAIDATEYTDNGNSHTLEAAPFIANDRTMVPLRVISEALGATDLAFDAGVITFNINGSSFTMTVDQSLPNDMGTPVIAAERTFVPLAFIVNEMGASARWDDVLRAAYIYI